MWTTVEFWGGFFMGLSIVTLLATAFIFLLMRAYARLLGTMVDRMDAFAKGAMSILDSVHDQLVKITGGGKGSEVP
jgi:hypothetical protein